MQEDIQKRIQYDKRQKGKYQIKLGREGGKDQESIHQSPHLTQVTIWKSDKKHKNIAYKRAKSPQGCKTDMVVWQRQIQITKNDPQKILV